MFSAARRAPQEAHTDPRAHRPGRRDLTQIRHEQQRRVRYYGRTV